MEMTYYIIEPIEGLTAKERGELISQELFFISRPKVVRDKKDVTNRLFRIITHAETGATVLCVPDPDYLIKVHPENDLTILMLLYPSLSKQEKDGLIAFIKSQDCFSFRVIVPSVSESVDHQYLIDNGFIQENII